MEIDPFIFRLSIFILSIFIGYYVVWSVTPSLHTPLMSVTNAISGIVVVGALLVTGLESAGTSAEIMGFFAVLLASINVAEKGYVTLDLTARAPGGHSSLPPRDTAVGRLAKAISKPTINRITSIAAL